MFFKKKVEEPEIIPLTNEEISGIKEKLVQSESAILSVTDLTIDEICPQPFTHGVINILDGIHTLFIYPTVNSDQYKTFRKSRGGRFNADVLDFTRGKETGRYVLIKNKTTKKIVRLIDDKDILLYKTLKLINGIIKDKPYMLVREMKLHESLVSTKKYIKENKEEYFEDDIDSMSIQPVIVKSEDDDHEHNATSVSLFDI